MIKNYALELGRELTQEEIDYIGNRLQDDILSIQRPVPAEMIGRKVIVRAGYSSNIVGEVTHVKKTTFGFVSGDFIAEMPNHRFVSSYDDKPSY